MAARGDLNMSFKEWFLKMLKNNDISVLEYSKFNLFDNQIWIIDYIYDVNIL